MPTPKFDIAIVGAGAAGLEIARMASRAGQKVALIEQGAASGRHVFQRIPLMVGKIIGNPRFVDAWQSIPLHAAGGEPRPVLAGRGLGGSSRVNGNVAYAGPGFRYDTVFSPLGLDFSNILKALQSSADLSVPRVHSWYDALSARFMTAAEETGAKRVQDPDADFFGTSVLHVNTKKGWRFNHLDGYLASADHREITLIRDQAVKIDALDHREKRVILSEGAAVVSEKIVICCGAIGAPTLLMRSGIGGRETLKHAGIDLRHELTHVGRHLKDHANLRIPFSCPSYDTLNQKTRGISAFKEGLKFLMGSENSVLRGPGASAGVNVEGRDPYRIQLVHFTQDRSQVGNKGIVFERSQGASLGMYALWPKSEGSVWLDQTGLKIDPGFLRDEHDVHTTMHALKHARNLIAQMGFDTAASEWDDDTLIRKGVYSGYHLIGSNRMSKMASEGVVDPQFSVHGLNGVYVCDASVMPDHLSSHSYLATVAMARMFGQQRGWK